MIPAFPDANLEKICAILGNTSTGLTGSEISRYLEQCGIDDPLPEMTKRHRLFEALRSRQRADRCANHVVEFIEVVMNPVKHTDDPEFFESEREKLNVALAFSGLMLTAEGTVTARDTAKTLSEAQLREGIFRKALADRKVHVDVLRFCRSELLADNYFHAVLEATKSIADKIRSKTGLSADGTELVDQAFGTRSGTPILAFNTLQTESEKSEHKGLMNLIKGVLGAFRNTGAHAPRIHWNLTEQDALDVLTTISLLHRRIDEAVANNARRVC